MNRNNPSNFGCLLIVAIILLVINYACIETVSALKIMPESYEYNVRSVASNVGTPEYRERTAGLAILLSSSTCPDGAVMVEMEVWPEIMPTDTLEWCDGGIEEIGQAHIDALNLILMARLQSGLVVDNYHLVGMDKETFWSEVYGAVNAAIEDMYHEDKNKQYLPMMGQ